MDITIDFSSLNKINNNFFGIDNKEAVDCTDEIENLLINELKGLSKDEIGSIVDRANEIYKKLDNLDNEKIDSLLKSLKDKDFDKLNNILEV